MDKRDITIRQLKLTKDWKEEYINLTLDQLLEIKKTKSMERDALQYTIQKIKYDNFY